MGEPQGPEVEGVVLRYVSRENFRIHSKRTDIYYANKSSVQYCSILYRLRGTATKRPGPKVIKLFSYSTQLSTKFILLINVKMSTIVGI